jgi:hypothetical protein
VVMSGAKLNFGGYLGLTNSGEELSKLSDQQTLDPMSICYFFISMRRIRLITLL